MNLITHRVFRNPSRIWKLLKKHFHALKVFGRKLSFPDRIHKYSFRNRKIAKNLKIDEWMSAHCVSSLLNLFGREMYTFTRNLFMACYWQWIYLQSYANIWFCIEFFLFESNVWHWKVYANIGDIYNLCRYKDFVRNSI